MDSRDEFIREITLKICSSLDIKESLRSAFEYLREHVSLDVLALFILDERLGAVRHIAFAYENGAAVPPDEIIPMPEGMPEKIAARNFSAPFIVDTGKDEIFRTFGPLARAEGNTDLIVPLRLQGKLLGGLTLRAAGKGRYTDEQVQLLGGIAKPFAIALANALAHEEVLRYQAVLLDDKRFLSRELHGSVDEIIGVNTGLRNVMEMVRQVAHLNNTVLLLGETGTGKEMIANAIHYSSPRNNGPFIKVNCGALPESLIDSELFGHERGAFTGAVAENRGRFERADGGTIFLDEIGELPPTAQVRLLRVLQNHEVERVGGKRPIPVSIRVIAATHRNLQSMMAEGSFREDLWYRLSGFPIIVPPLRQRKDDVPALTRHFVAVKSRELGMAAPPSIAPGALMRLMDYDWPGNVRELENLVERELIRHRGGPLTFEAILPMESEKKTAAVGESASHCPLKLDEAMAAHIRGVLEQAGGKIHGPGGAAELLGLNPNTLRWRLDKLGISYRRRDRKNR